MNLSSVRAVRPGSAGRNAGTRRKACVKTVLLTGGSKWLLPKQAGRQKRSGPIQRWLKKTGKC